MVVSDGMQEEMTLGTGAVTQSAHATDTKKLSGDIAKGKVLQGLDNKERKIIQDINKILMRVADEGDLITYRSQLQTVLMKYSSTKRQKKQPTKGFRNIK